MGQKKKDEILLGDIIYQVQISLAWNYIQQIELFTIDTSLLNIPIWKVFGFPDKYIFLFGPI